ncbi:pancreatic progenitor cell differentiation and proliferation factor-like protein [Heptranchias perlo]|uniref:pancreatic progenitor cell differentiation and proliferation factor-like protein n=1 Tax=Heptranchias perlo TaxID=212740 RepID=UPI0035595FFD
MATVPSAGCLLARNQFYRSRLNPVLSASSSSSYINNAPKEGVLIPDQESSHQGLPIAVEKSWWISCLFANPIFSKFSVGR